MKKVFSVLLALCLLIGALPMFASAADAVSGTLETGLTWRFQDGTLTISGNGPMPDFEGSLGADYTEIYGVPWYEQGLSSSVKSLVIEEGVTHIGKLSFTFMELDPANIKIASSVTSIGNGSFAGCIFSGPLVLPNTIKSLGWGAFFHAAGPSITVPDGIKELPSNLFYCFGLDKVYLPASVTRIYAGALNDYIKDIYYAGTEVQWNQIQGLDYDGSSNYNFMNDIQGVEVHFSDGDITTAKRVDGGTVTDNIEWTFYDDGTLELTGTGELPELTFFSPADGSSDYVSTRLPPWFGFYDPLSSAAYDENQDYRDMIKKAVIGEGITSIGTGTFGECSLLTEVSIPASIKRIEHNAFGYCSDFLPSESTIKNVYYGGSEKEWKAIKLYDAGYDIISYNPNYVDPYKDISVEKIFPNATIHFNGGDTPNPPTPSTGFNDVKSSDYFADPVKWAVDNNITAGTGGNKFSPGKTCTRDQIVTFLYRSKNSPEVTVTDQFTDMPKLEEFQRAISWAVEQDITVGDGKGHFLPAKGCTRAEAMTFIWRAAGKPEPKSIAAFSDMPDSSDFQKAISWAAENGITSGVGGNRFGPDKTCTRGQIVTFLYNAKDL